MKVLERAAFLFVFLFIYFYFYFYFLRYVFPLPFSFVKIFSWREREEGERAAALCLLAKGRVCSGRLKKRIGIKEKVGKSSCHDRPRSYIGR